MRHCFLGVFFVVITKLMRFEVTTINARFSGYLHVFNRESLVFTFFLNCCVSAFMQMAEKSLITKICSELLRA